MIRQHDSLIVQKISHILIPLIQLFAFYVFFHGHYSPGGGFQAGVLVGASVILQMLIESREERSKLSLLREYLLACFGVVIFLSVGAGALFYGQELFDYHWLPLWKEESMRRYYGILIAEAGVTLVVSMTLIVIFHLLAAGGVELEEK